ncbi:AAA family ATPase, partial [Vibrio parahaemolyticus]|uniref:ParA family protein n=1 Tax=Vibrio parahaemolyticus TaxID=670 RepID=UPI0021121882
VSAKEAIIKNTPAGYDVIGSNGDLTAAEVCLTKKSSSPQTLLHALEPIQSEYDYILMDCPPSLNMLTLNGLVTAHRVFIAMQCEYFA